MKMLAGQVSRRAAASPLAGRAETQGPCAVATEWPDAPYRGHGDLSWASSPSASVAGVAGSGERTLRPADDNPECAVSRPRRLGSWTCPSGNSCGVDLVPVRDGMAMLAFDSDTPPPLRLADELYYRAVILPSVVRLVGEYTERIGPGLVVAL